MKQTPSDSDTYFVTSITHERRRIFQLERKALLMIETLRHYEQAGKYTLHAFVVMPDHIHLLLTPKGIALERAAGLIKGGFSYRLHSKMPVWQTGYRDHRCRDDEEFIAYRKYIHMNPVRAGFVLEPSIFTYSSAFDGANIPSAAEAAGTHADDWQG